MSVPSEERPLSGDETRRLGPTGVRAALEAHRKLQASLAILPDKPEETPVSALRALWLVAGGRHTCVEDAIGSPLMRLHLDQVKRFSGLVHQRLAGVPLAHLTERQRFMGIEMLAGPGALIPRKETEILGHAALEVVRQFARELPEVRVMDVCTGSGNLAAAIARAEPRAVVYASDLSEDAVALAQRNFQHLGLEHRITLRAGDLFAPFDDPSHTGFVHLIVCNPPYISSRRVTEMPSEIADHEPRLAFDGGALGVGILQRLIREAPRMLCQGGWLAFEVGVGQGPSVARRMQSSGAYGLVNTVLDDDGQARALLARRDLHRAEQTDAPAVASPGNAPLGPTHESHGRGPRM